MVKEAGCSAAAGSVRSEAMGCCDSTGTPGHLPATRETIYLLVYGIEWTLQMHQYFEQNIDTFR
jgi:hypothetical protein